MASGCRNRAEVLLACWVIVQVIPPLCLTTPVSTCRRSRSRFDDLASRSVRASIILDARVRRVLGFDPANGTQRVVFTVERVLKGVYPVIGAWRSSILVFFSKDLSGGGGGHSVLHFQECLREVIRNGSRYVVFVDDAAQLRRYVLKDRSRWLTTTVLKASGLPRIATESLLRIVKNYSCSRCGRSPRAEVWPQLVDLTVGKSLELECRVTGRPKAKVTWFKDGVAIPREGRLRWKTTRNGSRLRIRRVALKDNGLFQCLATNVLGTSNAPRSMVTISRSNLDSRPHSRVCDEQTYCLNGGVCHRLKSLKITYCHCRTGFEGERCQQKRLHLNAMNIGKSLI